MFSRLCHIAIEMSSVTICITMATILCSLNDVLYCSLKETDIDKSTKQRETDTDLESLTPEQC